MIPEHTVSELDIAGGKSGRLMLPQEAINRPVTLTCWSGDVTAESLVGGITNHDILVRDQNKKYVVQLGQDIPKHMVMR